MIYINKSDTTPLYLQLYNSIIEEIKKGTLPTDSSLPPIRYLASELNVSLNTVQKAYQQLLAEGYIRAIRGSGYYVENITNTFLEQLDLQQEYRPQKISRRQQNQSPKIKYDFKHDAIFPHLFPWKTWRQYVNNALIEEENQQKIQYESNKGNLKLRTNLCNYLNRNRGVNCSPEQIIITPGTQYAIEIISRLLPASHHKIAYEEPAHNGMRNIFLQNHYDLTLIPVLKNGIDIDALASSDCDLLYVMPSHQFPTGHTIPISNRYRLLEWAVKNDAYIIENDYDSQFTYQTRPIPALQSLDKYGHVIYFDTLSKVLTPSMRTAFFILPYPLLEKYEQMYQYFNSSLPSFNQMAMAEFISSGDFERHLRKLIKINEKKCRTLIKNINIYLKKHVEIIDTPAGSHIIVRIKHCIDQQKLINDLKRYQIAIYGVKEYWHTSSAPEDIFLLGFSSLNEKEIPSACQQLAEALDCLLEK